MNKIFEVDVKGLRALQEDQKMKRAIVVSRDPKFRKLHNVEIWPVKQFCKALWNGEIF